MSWHNLKDIILENNYIQLRRVYLQDRDSFAHIAFDEDIWRYFVAKITNEQELNTFIEEAIKDTLNGTRIVFAIIDRQNHQIVGSTAFGNLSKQEKKLEIGWSWLGKKARGTHINLATKHALLNYAFEHLHCERVEFKTDVLNTVARRGLLRIGAKEEGVLRSFNYMPDGRRRDAIYYSILLSEWSTVRNEYFKDFQL